jgi:hypothetical protein
MGKPVYVRADHVLMPETAELRPQVINAYQKDVIALAVSCRISCYTAQQGRGGACAQRSQKIAPRFTERMQVFSPVDDQVAWVTLFSQSFPAA